MATAVKAPRRTRLARVVIAVSLVAGLAVAAVSYLGSSLMIPGPADRAGTDELRARGAAVWVEFCNYSWYEPHFWPECVGDPDDWRPRGADRLVAFCTQGVASRLFSRADCLAEDRPVAALSGGPRPQDAAAGLIGAGVAAVVVTPLAWIRGRRRESAAAG